MAKTETVKQCKSCPWRVECVPDRDIPNYKRELHEKLSGTIRSGVESLTGASRIMVCHHSALGKEIPCAGWLANQLGPGNNIGLRLRVLTGVAPVPEVDGPQHPRFEDTLRRPGRRKARRA